LRAARRPNVHATLDYHRFPLGRDGRATAHARVVNDSADYCRRAPILSEDRGLSFFTVRTSMTSVAGVECREQEPWQSETQTVVRIALAGCGSVGSALLREIAARREAIAERHGVEIVLTRLLVRDLERKRDASFDPALLTNDVDEFLAAEADIVVEAIGGFDPARKIAETVLGRGQRLVTANKLLLAAHGSALTELARR